MKILITACYLITVLLFSAAAQDSFAGSAAWSTNPISGDWQTAENWVPNTVPNDPADIATFAQSNVTQLLISAVTEVSGLNFESGASSFTITGEPGTACIISGAGITNDSGKAQTFTYEVNGGFQFAFSFENSASAGEKTVFFAFGGGVFFLDAATADQAMIVLGAGPDLQQGSLDFFDSSTAAEATVEVSDFAIVNFFDSSTAANAVFTGTAGGFFDFSGSATAADGVFTLSEGGGVGFAGFATAANGQFTANGADTTIHSGCFVNLADDATAGEATFIINGGSVAKASGAVMTLFGNASAGNSTVTLNGGSAGGEGGALFLNGPSDGGTASLALFGNGQVDIGGHNRNLLTIGSLEGNGQVFFGARALAVGSNNRSTVFSGVIQDGGVSLGKGGSLTKVGTGTLALSGANTYTGGTTVSAGRLVIDNTADSSTGTGAVQVNAGTLAGQGTMAGAVTIGSGSGAGAVLAPGLGAARPGTLTIQSNLTCKGDATYTYRLNTKKGRSDQVIANGVTIESGAQFDFQAIGHGRLRAGKVAIAINNTSAAPISGDFANLPDGSTIDAGPNKLQVSYTGGDGNDLTLSVVP